MRQLPREIFESRCHLDWEKNAEWFGDHEVFFHDHLGGFSKDFSNPILDKFPPGVTVRTEYIVCDRMRDRYPDLSLKFDAKKMVVNNYFKLFLSQVKPKSSTIENFLCSFFRTHYHGRDWLICWLYELGWFNFEYSSKQFVINQYPEQIKYLYQQYLGADFDHPHKQQQRSQFCQTQKRFGLVDNRNDHLHNLHCTRDSIQKSFVCIVAETQPAHYYPFPTEKFLYPIVNSSLWVASAQLGYHEFISKHLGFKLYDCFDYSFDSIPDPLERMLAMTQMLVPFASMLPEQWSEVYQSQKAIIDFNAEHVRSGNFIARILKLDEVGK